MDSYDSSTCFCHINSRQIIHSHMKFCITVPMTCCVNNEMQIIMFKFRLSNNCLVSASLVPNGAKFSSTQCLYVFCGLPGGPQLGTSTKSALPQCLTVPSPLHVSESPQSPYPRRCSQFLLSTPSYHTISPCDSSHVPQHSPLTANQYTPHIDVHVLGISHTFKSGES